MRLLHDARYPKRFAFQERQNESEWRHLNVLFTRLHVYTFTRLHVYTFTRLHVYTFTRLHVYTFTRLHVYTFTRLHVYTLPCDRLYECVFCEQIVCIRNCETQIYKNSLHYAWIHLPNVFVLNCVSLSNNWVTQFIRSPQNSYLVTNQWIQHHIAPYSIKHCQWRRMSEHIGCRISGDLENINMDAMQQIHRQGHGDWCEIVQLLHCDWISCIVFWYGIRCIAQCLSWWETTW